MSKESSINEHKLVKNILLTIKDPENYSIYGYNGVCWLGPTNSYSINIYKRAYNPNLIDSVSKLVKSTKFLFVACEPLNLNKLYSINSTYLSLEKEPSIMEEKKSYTYCFNMLMSYIEDEIRAGDDYIIKCCIVCHKLIPEPIKLGIVGWRGYDNYGKFTQIVDNYIMDTGQPSIIVSGGASGIDTLAQKYAREKDIKFVVFEAEWDRYGDSAGPMRNELIVNECTHILALPSNKSVGTYDTICKARRKGLHVTVFNI